MATSDDHLRTFAFSTKDFCHYEGLAHLGPHTSQDDFIKQAKGALIRDLKSLSLKTLAERVEGLELHIPPLAYLLDEDHKEEVIWLCDCPHSHVYTDPLSQ